MKNMIIVLFVMITNIASAQNNAIFKGGNADGWEKTAFAQASNNIFTGGNNDGHSITAFAQAGNNIFTGGNGDGWDKASFAQAINNIFAGGNGDGWDKASFAQAINNIFNGGAGDGWDRSAFAQAFNNIFIGGQGDGWASQYIPLGPLPVTFLSFTAGKNSGKSSLLNWETSQEINSAYFDIERSGDAMFFTKIGTVAAAGNSTSTLNYSFIDNDPAKGLNYYRLKQTDIDGKFIYTPVRLVKFGEVSSGSVKTYPNPTSGLITLEINLPAVNEMKLINISNAAGIMVNQLKLGPSTDTKIQIDLSRYAKGIYFIQVKTSKENSVQRIVLQ